MWYFEISFNFHCWGTGICPIYMDGCRTQVENGRYGHTPIRSDTSVRVYTTADTDTSTPCVGVLATCNRGERIVTNRLPSHRIPKVISNRDYRRRQVIVTK